MAEILDLRGRELTIPPPSVLADPSGRRARLLARGGRVLALIALLWVAGLLLAGLGVLPAGDVPLGRAVAGPQAPSKWRHLPTPSAPTAQDLSPAIPSTATVGESVSGHALQRAGAASGRQPSAQSLTAAGQPGSTSGSGGGVQPTTAASTPAGGAARIGLTNATGRGHSGGAVAHGLTKTTAPGKSGSTPGQVRQATTPAGKSGTAPGHAAGTPSNGHAKLP